MAGLELLRFAREQHKSGLEVTHYEANPLARIEELERRLGELERLTPTAQGAGSGLDADLIDGLDVALDNDGTSGYLDIGTLRVMWGTATFTPSWTNATSHAYSGEHTVTLPASFDDTSFQIVAQGRDGAVSARSAWLVHSAPLTVSTFGVYIAAPDPAETTTTDFRVQYVAFGTVPT